MKKLFAKILRAQGLPSDGATPLDLARRERRRRGDAWIPPTNASYWAYTSAFDEVISADELVSRLAPLGSEEVAELDRRWTALITANSILVSSAMAAIEAMPDYHGLPSAVTLLIDHSGSMKGAKIESAAIAATLLVRVAQSLGCSVEVLGFTTCDWKGGRSRKQWLHDGRPPLPGRLNDLRHIVYVAAGHDCGETPFRTMLREELLRENIDGEALEWAANRLMARPESRKLLLVVSDGAPVDDSTNAQNPPRFLEDHLRKVVGDIDALGAVELKAFGLGSEPRVALHYNDAVEVPDTEQLVVAVLSSFREWSDRGGAARPTV